MTKRKYISRLSSYGIVLALALLAGCAAGTMVAYEGPALSREQIAIIKSPSGFSMAAFTSSAWINCIDGKANTGEEIHVLPGRHQIQISLFYQPSSRNFRGNLEFEAQANHEYLADGQVVSVGGVLGLEVHLRQSYG